MTVRTFRGCLALIVAAAFLAALTGVFSESVPASEPFRGWAPLKTRPLKAKYAIAPLQAVHPQPLVTIPQNPTPYPYGYFGAVGPHSNVQAGPGSAPGTRAWSYSFRR